MLPACLPACLEQMGLEFLEVLDAGGLHWVKFPHGPQLLCGEIKSQAGGAGSAGAGSAVSCGAATPRAGALLSLESHSTLGPVTRAALAHLCHRCWSCQALKLPHLASSTCSRRAASAREAFGVRMAWPEHLACCLWPDVLTTAAEDTWGRSQFVSSVTIVCVGDLGSSPHRTATQQSTQAQGWGSVVWWLWRSCVSPGKCDRGLGLSTEPLPILEQAAAGRGCGDECLLLAEAAADQQSAVSRAEEPAGRMWKPCHRFLQCHCSGREQLKANKKPGCFPGVNKWNSRGACELWVKEKFFTSGVEARQLQLHPPSWLPFLVQEQHQ